MYCQLFTTEITKLLSPSLTTALAIPFPVVLMGYWGAEKIHTAFAVDGFYATIMQPLPSVSITVYETVTAPNV